MFKHHISLGSMAFLLVVGLLHSIQTHAIALSDTPLFLAKGAEPNVMFVLDDSGSMQFEIMPDSLIKQDARYVFPRADGVYGGSDYNSYVPRPDNLYGMVARSVHNTVYYNPAIRYMPWAHPDGGLFPNASPTCALHNPRRAGGTSAAYCRNLTTAVKNQNSFSNREVRWVTCSSSSSCGAQSRWTTADYFPATYFYFSGTASEIWTASKYIKVEIKPSTATYTGHGRDGGKRTDCNYVNGQFSVCTYVQEIQNFANWYTYYRSRVLTARAGIGRAFAEQNDDIRVGFGAINKGSTSIDGVSSSVVISGVRQFTSGQKTDFLTRLYDHVIPNAGTPLRHALNAVGQYYERADNRGPWGKTPGTDDTSAHLECRASNTILMTDGYWSGTTVSVGNADGVDGEALTNHEPGAMPSSYKYIAGAPYQDDYSNTLADVAMTYWKTDLRPNLDNRVKPSAVNPAFWQHMTTFGVGLGVSGSVTGVDVASAIKNKISISWPNPTSAEPYKLDDLLHASINGHGGFFSAQDPDSFAAELSNVLRDITGRENNNAAAAAANSTSLNDNSVVYQALFSSLDWSGQIKATRILPDGSFGDELWQSSFASAADRKIFTFRPDLATGKEFLWSQLSDQQKQLLNDGDDPSYGEARLNWVRGVDNSIPGDPIDLRDRNGRILGDIVNSDPAFAGNNNSRFDRLKPSLGGDSYTVYYNEKKKTRRNVIYVGANDGMLHAFNASLTSGVPGRELFAYVPSMVINQLKDLSSEDYGRTIPHRYSVDGPVHVGDVYINGAWRNILVGTLGAGARGIFALDVTDPDNFSADDVLFELTAEQYPELGNILRTAVIAPGKDNRWKIYLGNGYNSSKDGAQKAFLGIIDIEDEVNKADDSRTRFIATNNATDNGLAQPALLPDADGTVRAAYAGDLRGNLWKFDLSSSSANEWDLAGNAPLFIAQRNGVTQPITSSPTLGVNTLLSPSAIMIYFGTGRYLTIADKAAGSDLQSFYAIADKPSQIGSIDRSSLHEKIMSTNGSARVIQGEYILENGIKVNAVDWDSVDGWYLDFGPGERITTKALLLYDRLIFPTIIPNEDSCGSGGTGWLMELIAIGNTNLDYSVIGVNGATYLEPAIFGQITSVEGTVTRSDTPPSSAPSTSSASSSSSSSGDCGAGNNSGGSGTIAVVGVNSDGEEISVVGARPCELFGRQSWRELR